MSYAKEATMISHMHVQLPGLSKAPVAYPAPSRRGCRWSSCDVKDYILRKQTLLLNSILHQKTRIPGLCSYVPKLFRVDSNLNVILTCYMQLYIYGCLFPCVTGYVHLQCKAAWQVCNAAPFWPRCGSVACSLAGSIWTRRGIPFAGKAHGRKMASGKVSDFLVCLLVCALAKT